MYSKIQSYIQRLDHLGYAPYQIRNIIQDAIGTASLETLSPEESQMILSYLEEYISFAIKCKEAPSAAKKG